MLRISGSVMLALALCSSVHAVTLYDGPLGTPPESQGWLAFGETGGTSSRTTLGGATTLDTTSIATLQAGYSNYSGLTLVNPLFPSLDRGTGFVVSLDMQVLSESHSNANRSGISLLVLSSDLQGIEVAFWQDEVWVQSGPDFVHAEGATLDTTSMVHQYAFTILGNHYSLAANGSELFSGSLRDYSSFGPPYNLPNYVFLGDNTTSAAGSFEFSRLVVVPEPAVNLFPLACLLLLLRRRLTV